MNNFQITSAFTSISRKVLAGVAIGVAAIAFAFAGPAHADTKQGSGGTKGCLIENDGHLETVPVGSKVGLFTCGQDGEWHFGWLINAISAPKAKANPGTTTGPNHGTAALHKRTLSLAKAAR
jgi:hypothetical protein